MSYRSFAIFTVVLCLLGLGAAFISCDNAGDDDSAPAVTERPDATPPARGATGATDEPGPADTPVAPPEEPGTADPAAEDGAGDAEAAAEPGAASSYVGGEQVYKAANCAMCHGQELQGTQLAPPLSGLKANWDAESLAEYLVDPVKYAENDPRLKANQDKYTLPMPAWRQTGLDEPDMHLLIRWLLARDE